ncbi:MAG: hypothetical protein AAF559_11870 [Pseudomonadota bacterium]
MSRRLKKTLSCIVLVSVAAVFGPVLIAAVAALISINLPPNRLQVRTEAQKLVSAYRDEEKNKFMLSTTALPPDGAECGYEPVELFPGDQLMLPAKERRFTHYWGYFILDDWRSDFEWEDFNKRIAEELDENSSQFQLGFLRRCINFTLARPVCMSQVEDLVRATAKRVPRSLGGTQSIHRGTVNDVVCL